MTAKCYIGAVKKCYWTFAFLLMTAAMLFSLHAMTSKYLSNPVAVDVSVRQEKKIDFPAITICNMSPVKKSALEAALSSKRRKKRQAQNGRLILLDIIIISAHHVMHSNNFALKTYFGHTLQPL